MPSPRRSVVLAALAALAVPATGCGRERLAVPDASRPDTNVTFDAIAYPEAGLRLQAPREWIFERGRSGLVASAVSGTATIAIWRYPRSEPLPRDEGALQAAEDTLLGAVKARDPQFAHERTGRVEIDGAPGIEVLGTQHVAGEERKVRSTHVYAKEAEFVVDAYAAPQDFEAVDRAVFRPLLRSFRIDPPTS